MEPANPYATPSANPYGSNPLTMEGSVAAETIAPLAGTKGWVQFMSIIMFVMSGPMAKIISQQQPNNPFAGGPIMTGMGVFYFLLALIYIYPAIKLWAYGNRIGDLKNSLRVQDLNAALHEQRRLWKSAGITTIIFILLMMLGTVAMFVFVGMAASRGI